MNDVAGIKQQASALRKQQKFEEAVALYRVLWQEHREECDEWDDLEVNGVSWTFHKGQTCEERGTPATP